MASVDAKTRGLQMLEVLYPDAAVRQARAQEIGEAELTRLGEHGLRQDEFSRSMGELQTQRQTITAAEAEAKTLYEQNKTWFADRQKDLQELETLRKQVASGAVHPAADDEPVAVTKADLAKTLEGVERDAVGFIRDTNRLSMEHFQKFGQVLDLNELLTDKRVQQIGIQGVYQERYKEQLNALAAAAAAKAEQAIRDDERKKVQSEQNQSYLPQTARTAEASTLDVIEAARTGQAPQVRTVAEMAMEYERLSAARSGAPV